MPAFEKPRPSANFPKKGASRRKIKNSSNQSTFSERLSAWFIQHRVISKQSVAKILQNPISSGLTWLVIAIALTLPALMLVSLQNLTVLTSSWQQGGQITLFLNSNSNADLLAADLKLRPEIVSVEVIDKEQAWDQMGQLLGQINWQDFIEGNPLPSSLVVTPLAADKLSVESLAISLSLMADVDEAQIDLLWIERLNQIFYLIERTVWVFAFLLALAVLLVVGNTIRLSIESRREEIVVAKLVGATDAFVRRPFLYMGFWYGMFGALGAWLMVWGCGVWLSPAVNQLAASYGGGEFTLIQWQVKGTLLLVTSSIIISMVGAWLAVWRHLRDIQPR